MECPNCKSKNNTVWRTEKYSMGIRRLRICEDCRNVWWTIETFLSLSKKEIGLDNPTPPKDKPTSLPPSLFDK